MIMSNLKLVFLKLMLLVFVSASFLNAQQLSGSIGNGVDASSFPTINWVSISLPTGIPVTTIGATTANGQGGDFSALFQAGFFTTQSGTLVSIVANLGTAVPIAAITGLLLGQNIIGMGYDFSTATMYLATSDFGIPPSTQLYTLNIGTGAAIFIANITNAPGLLAIAVNCDGEIYGFDAAGDNLVNINPNTGTGTIVGSLGVDALVVAQDADFDPESGMLYWTTFNGASCELRSVDVNTGNSTLITAWAADLISFGIYGDCPPTGVEQTSDEVPSEYKLSQNYPNPFNPTTNIEYSIPSESFVELKVYDILGNEVASLVNEQQQAGVYRADFTADNLPSGMYFARITANEFTQVVKMILLK